MITISEKVSQRLTELCAEWNYSEKVLKQHEGITESVVIPSINELRYGGRRLIEAIDLMIRQDSEEKILDLIAEAIFDCHRARHDAIDASASMMIRQYNSAREKLDIQTVIRVFPKFLNCISEIKELKKKIAYARENRHDRDRIYTEISRERVEKIISDYNEFLLSEGYIKEIMIADEKKQIQTAREAKNYKKIAVYSLIFAGISTIATIAALFIR